MAKARRAPEPSHPGRRDGTIAAILALMLAAATAWLVFSELRPEYARHQRQFREMVRQRSGDAVARSAPAGIQQIWLPASAAANRCVTCHVATTWKGFEDADLPLRTHPAAILGAHPVERFGCTCCHGGQGWAVDRARAHGRVAYWSDPLVDAALAGTVAPGVGTAGLMQVHCNACHRYERETAGAGLVNRAKQLVDQKGCRACHRINGRGGLIGPDLDGTGDKNPAQYDYRQLEGRRSAFRWHTAHFRDPRALVADTVMPNFHFSGDEPQALAVLVMSWQRAKVAGDLLGGLLRSDPEPEEQRKRAAEMAEGPGGWFVKTGCYTCHPVAVFGIASPTPIGPDLSTAADDAERRFSRPIDEFIRNPVGTMRAVFSRQFMLSPGQKDEAIRQLRAAFAEYEAKRAAGWNPLAPAAASRVRPPRLLR